MRLIDADALNKKLCETTIFIKDGEVFQRMINDAPTIEPDADTISRQDAIDVVGYEIDGVYDAIVNRINSLTSAEPRYMGCHGCVHYDQQQTALICRDCKRSYMDKYEDGEEE